jgi:hypothetical protein
MSDADLTSVISFSGTNSVGLPLKSGTVGVNSQGDQEPIPTTLSYSAGAVKIYSATNCMARFYYKNYLSPT